MIKKVGNSDKKRILQVLESDISNCLYMYIDIKNYDIESEMIELYEVMDGNDANIIFMRYYDSYQIYARGTINTEIILEISEFMNDNPKSMISGPRWLIEMLEDYMRNYRVTYGEIFIIDKYRKIEDTGKVKEAKISDAVDIAKLVCNCSEMGLHYKIDNLTRQLEERISTRTGRSYIIREDGKIVAHTATYAECDGIAVVSGTIVEPKYRDSNYYLLISSYMSEQMDKENKKVYTFSFDNKMIRYHERMHQKCGEYGKMERQK